MLPLRPMGGEAAMNIAKIGVVMPMTSTRKGA
jgi:hypothetical protein